MYWHMAERSRMGRLTERQMQVLRYRKEGMTQQQIADIFRTSKENISRIERSARENIVRAKKTLEIFYTLGARRLCSLKEGSDLFDSVSLIRSEAEKIGVSLAVDAMDIINRLREEFPERIHGRLIREDIQVFLDENSTLVFG